jgi:hypothetical protein
MPIKIQAIIVDMKDEKPVRIKSEGIFWVPEDTKTQTDEWKLTEQKLEQTHRTEEDYKIKQFIAENQELRKKLEDKGISTVLNQGKEIDRIKINDREYIIKSNIKDKIEDFIQSHKSFTCKQLYKAVMTGYKISYPSFSNVYWRAYQIHFQKHRYQIKTKGEKRKRYYITKLPDLMPNISKNGRPVKTGKILVIISSKERPIYKSVAKDIVKLFCNKGDIKKEKLWDFLKLDYQGVSDTTISCYATWYLHALVELFGCRVESSRRNVFSISSDELHKYVNQESKTDKNWNQFFGQYK